MLSKLFRYFPLFCLLLLAPKVASAAPEIELLVGEQSSFPVDAGARFSVGNPEVLQVKNTQLANGKSVLLLKGKQPGYSDILIFSSDAKQQSVSVHVGMKPKHAFVSTPTAINPMTRLDLVKRINERLLAAQLMDIHARGVGATIFLEGVAKSKTEKELAEILSKEVFPGTRSYVQLPFEAKDILRFKVQILELAKSGEHRTGLEWSDEIPGILQLHQGLLKASVSLESSLHALEHAGLVKILSEPVIALNAEGIAELKVGGEIPIPLRSLHFSYVQWKPYGLTLHLEVPGVATNSARTSVLVEMSSIDHANAIDGVPGTKVNRMQTVVDLTLGKPIFLSGLMQQEDDSDIKSVPALSSIPILGELFKSKDFQEHRTELVIALTAKKGV